MTSNLMASDLMTSDLVRNRFIVAVDGPAASGKGTLTRALAQRFALTRLDTGRLYRMLAQLSVEHDVQPDEPETLADLVRFVSLAEAADPTENAKLHGEQIATRASLIAPQPLVRNAMKQKQLAFIASAEGEGVVLDGRDTGTAICPEAPCKIFLSADVECRARRRLQELLDRKVVTDYQRVLKEMQDRDTRDRSRSVAPLRAAESAFCIDSTRMSKDAVFVLSCCHVSACRASWDSL